jgi:two-component system, OmpR family, response regulator AdeR
MENALIQIVEDESQIAEVLSLYLQREGFRTVCASDGQTALDQHLLLRPDLVLLDVKLPKKDGFEVLAEVRYRGNTPVIMITALKDDLDKLTALRIGADDYIVKPFNAMEVVARVKSVLRRTLDNNATKILRAGTLEIDLMAHSVRVVAGSATKLLNLTLTEFCILVHMARSPSRAFSRNEIVDACLPEGEAMGRTVDSHISNLRRKIESAGGGTLLESVRSLGYRLEPLK